LSSKSPHELATKGVSSYPQGMNLIDDIDFFSAVVAALQ
jgi:hypothetical protein